MSVLWYPTIKQAPLPGLVGMGGGADALSVLGAGGDPDKGKQLIPDGSTLRMQIDYRTDTSMYASSIYNSDTSNVFINTFDWDSTSGNFSAITDTSGTMDSGLSGYSNFAGTSGSGGIVGNAGACKGFDKKIQAPGHG